MLVISILYTVSSYHPIHWAVQNAGFLSLVFSIIALVFSGLVAFATFANAQLTGKLVAETKAMREVETEPEIFVQLLPNPWSNQRVELVVSNVGRGVARDALFVFDPPLGSDKRVFISDVAFFKQKRDILPSQSRSFFFGSPVPLLGDPPVAPITVSVSYSSHTAQYAGSFVLDIRDLTGLRLAGQQVDQQANEEIAKALKTIANTLEGVVEHGTGSRIRVEAATLKDTKAELDEELQILNEREALTKAETSRQSRIVSKTLESTDH